MKYTASIGVLALIMGVSASPLAQYDTQLAQVQVENSSFNATATALSQRATLTKVRVQAGLGRIIDKLKEFKSKCKDTKGTCKASFDGIRAGVQKIKDDNENDKASESSAVDSLREDAESDRDELEKKRKDAAEKMQDAIDKNKYDATQNTKGCSSYKTSPDMYYKCYDSVRCCPGQEMMYLQKGKVQCKPTEYLIEANSGYKTCKGTVKIGVLTFEQSLQSKMHHNAWTRQAYLRRQKNIAILSRRREEAMNYFAHLAKYNAQMKILAGATQDRKDADSAVAKAKDVLKKAEAWWTKCKTVRVPKAEKTLDTAEKKIVSAGKAKAADIVKADGIIKGLDGKRVVADKFHKTAITFTGGADLRRLAAKKSVAIALKNRQKFRLIRDTKMKESVQAHQDAADQMQKAMNFGSHKQNNLGVKHSIN